MKYTRDLPEDATPEDLDATKEHVRDHLASIADTDDDPTTHGEDVTVRTEHRDGRIWVIGELDAEADAPYLKDDYDPYAKVPRGLLAQAVSDEVGP